MPSEADKFGKLLDATSTLMLCQRKACKKEWAAAQAQADKVRQEMSVLAKRLTDKKMSLQKFLQASKDLRERVQASDETLKLQRCTVKRCAMQTAKMLDALLQTWEETCKQEKQSKVACERARQAKKIFTAKANNSEEAMLKKMQAVQKLAVLH